MSASEGRRVQGAWWAGSLALPYLTCTTRMGAGQFDALRGLDSRCRRGRDMAMARNDMYDGSGSACLP